MIAVYQYAGGTGATFLPSRGRSVEVTPAVMETVVMAPASEVAPAVTREAVKTPAVMRDETPAEMVTRMITEGALPDLPWSNHFMIAGDHPAAAHNVALWVVDWTAQTVSIDTVKASLEASRAVVALYRRACDTVLEERLDGKRMSLLTEAIRLQNILLTGGTLTAEESADAIMLRAIQSWDYDMVAARDTAYADNVAPSAIAWPAAPAGLADFLESY